MIGNVKALYEREIERKPLNNIMFYGGLAVLTFLILFVFGIRPTFLAWTQNNQYLEEITQIRNNMKLKLQQVTVAEAQIQALGKEIEKLNAAVPDDILPQEFLQELVLKSAGAGYAIQRVKVGDVVENGVEIDLDAAGPLDRLGEFVEGIEGMKRFTVIEDIRFSMEEGVAMVKLRVEVYKL